eukprot:Partr_v1_DN26910_c0_g1_i1_m7157 putative MOB kinase activator
MLEKSKFFVEDKTFRSKKNFAFLQNSTKRDQMKEYLVVTLGGGSLKHAVACPPGQDKTEWLAINTVDFFNQINMIYGCLTEFCTADACPVMTAGKKFEYLLWPEATENNKACAASAPLYISKLMEWIEKQLDDEKIFPHDGPFPKTFLPTVKTIFKRLFRVYAHIYHNHMDQIESIGEQQHLNTCFKHFIYFVEEYELVDKQEQRPLAQIIEQLLNNHR